MAHTTLALPSQTRKMHRLAHTCVNLSNSLMLLKSQSYTVPLNALAHIQDMRPEPKQNSMFSPRNSQVPRPETLPQALSPNRTRLRRTTGSNRPKYQRGTKQARNQRWRRPEAGARAAYLLAGEGRGEEVDAVGAAPQRLLLRRQRLRAAPASAAPSTSMAPVSKLGAPRDPPPPRATRRRSRPQRFGREARARRAWRWAEV